MYTDEDRRRLLESRHDIGACEDAAVLTQVPAYKDAVVASRAELVTCRDALLTAAALVSKEKSETDLERAKLQEAVAALIRRYGFVRGKVQDGLLNVDPDNPLPASEMLRRTRLFERVFRAVPSDLERASQRTAIEKVGGVVKALTDEDDLKPFNFAATLAVAKATAEAAAKSFDRETSEDAAAMTGLRAAREAHDSAAEAHALLVSSVLVRAGRSQEVGSFILSRDAAYAARRAARVPIDEEEGVSVIDTEPPPEKPA